MSPTLKDLLPPDQQPLTVHRHDTVLEAIERLRAHQYNQLPVVDEDGRCLAEVISFDTIVQAVISMDAKLSELRVKDATKQVKTYREDDDLLTTLDAIQRENFALIVDEGQILTGIVTTADTTVYFHNYARDLMVIEGIEESVKDAIDILYGGLDAPELVATIEAVTDRAADIRSKLPSAIRAYLGKMAIPPPAGEDGEALSAAESKLNLPKAGKAFDRLSFDEFTGILLRHPKAPTAGETNSVDGVRRMLNKVRDTRNKLAHFRGDVSVAEREHLKFTAQWFERNQPVITTIERPADGDTRTEGQPPSTTSNPKLDVVFIDPPYENSGEDDSIPQGKFAALSEHLAAIPPATTNVRMTFPEIEKVLGEKLPESAYEYRAWWTNDPSKPNAAAWLTQGWKAQGLSMSEKRVSFVRTDDRQRSYINFFSLVNARMENELEFPPRVPSPQGYNWHRLALLPCSGSQRAEIVGAFVRQKRFRIELYLDNPDEEANKARFDALHARQAEFEQQFGEPLKWERLEGRRACRIAIYTDASILTDSENEDVVHWAVQKAVDFYRVFGPEFTESPVVGNDEA